MEISDAQKEREAIAALRDVESRVNHSELIISLLSQAITHFKKHSSNRMRLYLMYNLAEEYVSSKNYEIALNNYNHIVQAYRAENWWPILEAILPSAVRCAYLGVSLIDWIRFSLELLNPSINVPIQLKDQTQTNLENFIRQGIAPKFDSTLSSKDEEWKALFTKQTIPVDADMFKGLLECKVYFTHEAVSIDGEITLQVALKSGFPLPIEFSRLLVHFNIKEYDDLVNVTNSEKLKFATNEQRILTFSFAPKPDHIQRTLEVTCVSLTYGAIDQTHIEFEWRTSLQTNPMFQQTSLMPKWRTKAGHIFWENIPMRRKTSIIMTAAKVQLTVEHQLPALFYEPYPMKIQIKNCENVDIHSAILTCTCSHSEDASPSVDDTHLSYSLTDHNAEITAHLCSMTFPTINKDATIEQDLYVRCNNNRARSITIRLAYERSNLYCVKETTVQLTVVNPFSIQFQTMGMMMQPLASLHAQEPFILMIDTKCTSTIPITIVSSSFKPSQFVVSECAIESQINHVLLKSDEVVSEGFCLRTQPIAAPLVQNLLVGDYSLFWRRSSHPHIPELCTTFSLSDFNVEQQEVYVEVTMPNTVPLQEPFQVNYRIHNRSNIVHEYKVILEQINLIVAVSGSTMTSLLVPPHSTSDVVYTLVATLSGFVQLPKFKLSMIRPQTQVIDEFIEKSLPTHIFVIPASKDE